MDAIDGVIYLTKCAVNEIVPDEAIVESLDLDAVYREASRHLVAAMIGMALKDAGVETEQFKQAIAKSQRKTIVLDEEKKRVFKELDKAGIWHMALKGALLKDWYPRFGMRESADVDVLIDNACEERVREIMISLGFTVESYGDGHTDNYHKKPLANFEMHVDLIGNRHRKIDYSYYENVKDRLVQKSEHEYAFTQDDFYIFQIAHEYKHYHDGGTGLRSIVDTYIMLNQLNLNWNYIGTECEKLGIDEFERKNRLLATHLFGCGELSKADHEMLKYILGSGAFGTIENEVQNKVARSGGGLAGKLQYVLRRVFLPLDLIREGYPFFYKHKILIPFLPIYRVLKVRKRYRLTTELKAVRKA